MRMRPVRHAARHPLLALAALAAALAGAPARASDTPARDARTSPVFTVLETCKDAAGKFQPATVITSSGHPEVDSRALRLSRGRAYRPGPKDEADERGCVRLRINFLVDERGRIVEPDRKAGRQIDSSSHADLPPNARE